MSANTDVVVKTLIFREAGDASTSGENSLKADIYYREDAADPTLPPILFFHGGALIMGDRHLSIKEGSLALALLNAGFTVVSADYRLAPQSTLTDIVQDVEDACRWVRAQAGTAYPGAANRLIVMGESAGGYLTLVAGSRITPRPDCLVSLWGYGDITGDWYATPSPFYCQMPAVSPDVAQTNGGWELYLYTRQTGTWPEVVTRWSLATDLAKIQQYAPRYNVDPSFPPTFFLTGTLDTDVPYTESTLMAHALAEVAVPCELLAIPGGGHGWGTIKPVDAHLAQTRIIEFLKRTI